MVPRNEAEWRRRQRWEIFGNRFTVVVGCSVLGAGLVAVMTRAFGYYGFAMFLGIPFLCGYIVGRSRQFPSLSRAFGAVMGNVAGMYSICFVGYVEGAVCLVMALPLVVIAGLIGAWIGHSFRDRDGMRSMLILPILAVVDHMEQPMVSVVATEIEVAAPASKVWSLVTGTIILDRPEDPMLKLAGVYGIRSDPEGRGIGSRRVCQFSTGKCVQEMVGWDEGRSLTAKVLVSPPPVREISPWPNLKLPHDDGFIEMKEYHIEVIPLGKNHCRLQRTTRYETALRPAGYFNWIGDQLIERIHRHKLDWVKRSAEVAK